MKANLHKIVIRMSKLCMYAMLLSQSLVMAMASETAAQRRFLKEISIELQFNDEVSQELELAGLINEIEETTGFNFAYSRRDVKGQTVQLSKNKYDLRSLLEEISAQGKFSIKRINETVTLIPVKVSEGNLPDLQEELVVQATVTGTITDENGEPLPGASIVEKGTSNGTITDIDGNFNLNISNDAVLSVSFVGYSPREIVVNGRSTIEVSLEPDLTSLEEVVVIGYGTASKKDVTGAIVSVDMEDANIAPNTSVMQAIQGKVPGINIGAVSSAGEEPSLSIRGQNSLSADNDPLIVVDGIIYPGSLNDFSTTDIASIDFLKDASAAAVYGSRAANGVVIITTKTGKGQSGKPNISFNTYTGIQEAGNLLDLMDGAQYIQKIIDYGQATGVDINESNVATYLQDNEIDQYNAGTEVDWYDQLLRKAVIQNYELGVSGTTENTKYYISGTYTDQEGIRKGDDFQRTTLRVNVSNDVTKWLNIGINTAYTHSDYSGQAVGFGNSVLSSPYATIYQKDNPSEYEVFPQTDQLISNPFLPLLNDDLNKQDNLFGVLNFSFKLPVEGLTYKYSYSRNLNFDRRSIFQAKDRAGLESNGIATKNNEFTDSWLMNNILDYSRTLNGVHKLGVTMVYTRDHQKYDNSEILASGFDAKVLGYNAVELGAVQVVKSDANDQSSEGFMARVNYGFDNRYFFTGTFRRDGFSGFAANNKYANFYSASLGWVMSEESFMGSVDWISFLKMRLSYGQNGNQGLGSYSSLAQVETSQYVFGDGSGTYNGQQVSTIANPNLKWETTKSTNLGMNFDLFNGRFSGDLDLYLSKTNDLLVTRSLPAFTGFMTTWTNLGEIKNKGIEVYLNSVNVKAGDFAWETGVTFSINRNEIVSLYGEDADGDGVEDDDISRGWFIGESIDAIYGFKRDGVYQVGDTDIPNRYREGDFRIVDTNEDGSITSDDRVVYGNELPNYRFGITNTITFKNLSLTAFVNSIQGGNNWYMLDNRALNPNAYFPGRANMVNIPYWTPDNPTNEYPRIDYRPRNRHRFDEDRSFVRLQDVTLTYDLSSSAFINRIGIDKLRLYTSGKNLATWTNWSGYDPELGTTLGQSPIMRSYVLGVQIGF